jgi:hypothetical protein
MPTQLFQQANRCRQIGSNEVHMFLRANPEQHRRFTCDFLELKAELNQAVRDYQRDWFVVNTTSTSASRCCSVPMPVRRSFPHDPPPPLKGHEQQELEQQQPHLQLAYIFLDTGICPVTSVRCLTDSLGNELYLHNQVRIHYGR